MISMEHKFTLWSLLVWILICFVFITLIISKSDTLNGPGYKNEFIYIIWAVVVIGVLIQLGIRYLIKKEKSKSEVLKDERDIYIENKAMNIHNVLFLVSSMIWCGLIALLPNRNGFIPAIYVALTVPMLLILFNISKSMAMLIYYNKMEKKVRDDD